MEITFQEAEFIKMFLTRALLGLNKIEEIGKDDFGAVAAFLGIGDSNKVDQAMELLHEEREAIIKMIDRINDEYGLNETYPGDGDLQ